VVPPTRSRGHTSSRVTDILVDALPLSPHRFSSLAPPSSMVHSTHTTPATLARTAAIAASPPHPALRPLQWAHTHASQAHPLSVAVAVALSLAPGLPAHDCHYPLHTPNTSKHPGHGSHLPSQNRPRAPTENTRHTQSKTRRPHRSRTHTVSHSHPRPSRLLSCVSPSEMVFYKKITTRDGVTTLNCTATQHETGDGHGRGRRQHLMAALVIDGYFNVSRIRRR